MRLQVSKAAANTLILTLKEKQELSAPNWLFVFFPIENLDTYHSVILADTSIYADRYNKFTLTLPTDIDITRAGEYIYKVFEQESAVNTTPPADEAGLCETGIMELLQTPPTEHFYTPT